MYTGPNIVRDGLVFGYDTGYGVGDNSTATRFYSGEPTTNVLNDTILGTGNGASLGSDDFGTYIQLANQTTSYSRFQLPNISVSSNETYTWSFELYSEDTITRSGNYLFDTNEYSDQFPASNDLSRLSTSQDLPSTLPARVWTPFRLTVTMKDNLTGAYSYDFFNMYYPGFQNKKIYYRNMQFERNKSHKTPYVGQGGTRSATQSLIDLTKTTDIDVSNVSFDSTGQPTFDGTDDSIILADPGVSSSTGFSIELVIKPGNASTSPMVIVPLSGGIDHYVRFNGNSTLYLRMIPAADSSAQDFVTSSTLSSSNYHHVIFTFKQSEGGKAFYNGNLENSASANFTALDWTSTWRVGQRGNNTYFYQGELPVLKIYNRALTAQEVQQNYKAYKNRFNI